MNTYIYGKKLCEKYSITPFEIANMCQNEKLKCYTETCKNQIIPSYSKKLIKKYKNIRTKSVYGLKFNNLIYTGFILDEKKSNYENYFNLYHPTYFDLIPLSMLNDESLINNIPPEFIWWMHIKDENSLADKLNSQKIIKVHLSYSVFYKISKTTNSPNSHLDLLLDLEDLKNKNIKIISRLESKKNQFPHNYTELNNCENVEENRCISSLCLNDLCAYNYENIDKNNLEICEIVDLDIIIYKDINNQITIKIINTDTPTTLTNAPFLKHISTYSEKNEKSSLITQKENDFTNVTNTSPLLQNDDGPLTDLFLLPIHHNISVFNQRKISEYLTLFDYDYYSPKSKDTTLEFKKDYYIFKPTRLKKLHYFENSKSFENDFIEFIDRLQFNEEEYIELSENERLESYPKEKSINFWSKFLDKYKLGMEESRITQTKLYIAKIGDNSPAKILYDKFYDNKNLPIESKERHVHRELKRFKEFAKEKGLMEYVVTF